MALLYKVCAFCTIVLLSTSIAKAQYNSIIRSDRPGQGNTPFAVGSKILQIQSGIDYLGYHLNNTNNSALAPNTVLKYGLSKHIDLTSAWEFKTEKTSQALSELRTKGLSGSSLGIRVNFTEGRQHAPAIGLQLSMKLPILSKVYNPNFIAPRIQLLAQQTINDKFALLINTGIDYNGVNAEPTGLYVANIGYSINAKWSTFLESYGSFAKGKIENKWNTGIAYLYLPDLQFDFFGGIGENNGRFDFYSSLGISWRVNTKRFSATNNS